MQLVLNRKLGVCQNQGHQDHQVAEAPARHKRTSTTNEEDLEVNEVVEVEEDHEAMVEAVVVGEEGEEVVDMVIQAGVRMETSTTALDQVEKEGRKSIIWEGIVMILW